MRPRFVFRDHYRETWGVTHRRPPEAVSGEDGRPFAASWICAPTKGSGFVSPFSDPFKRPPQRDGLRWAPWESPLPRDSQDGGREKNATLLVSSPPPCLIAEKGKMLERTKDERRDEQKAWRAPPQTAEEKLSRSAPTKEPCSSAPVLPVCSAECVRRRRAECCSLPVLRLRARFGRETSAGDRKRL